MSKTIYELNLGNNGKPLHPPALGAYLSLLQSIERHAIEINQDATRSLQLGLRSLYRELAADARPTTIESSESIVDSLLKTHGDATLAAHSQREGDVREILSVLGSVAESLTLHGERQNSRLKGMTEDLRGASRLHDLSEIRRALNILMQELRVTKESMWEENQRSVLQLQAQQTRFQERLDRAEKLAATDQLTGLLNRREGEARLSDRIAGKKPFCLMILDLDQFKTINDRNGHNAGDHVLRIFAKNLSKLLRPTDAISRWGGDEFVVLMDIPLQAATERAAQIRSKTSGRYIVMMLGREVPLQVSASIGIAEYRSGDDAEHLFARADQDLYKQKNFAAPLPV